MAASLELTFGILGNITSVLVYLSPISTFYKIYKKKSSQGFQSLPYVVALLSAALWVYYAILNSLDIILMTISSFGCLIEYFYIGVHLFYAPKKVRSVSLLLLGIGGIGLIFILTNFLTKGQPRLQIVGWFCVVFSVCTYAAPLNIMKQVIQTKNVEFMPFYLSLSLTISAIMWFFYGILTKNFIIYIPNVIGSILGVLQMILYAIYKNGKKVEEQGLHVVEERQTEVAEKAVEQCIDVSAEV
ncbi:bidirectional sugar transporter N3-like [Camellia sinensis]|uniref:bidirectional sugar transporter N3-like n=1 Tax=Camellia sinensis TaxID=4442 RepID=UPI001035F25E|nr:bidirectional sugar transporter N3-like [Camellia sinensis]